ncbi:ATP phosphoribosyltransferase regulatory subunit [Lusitaniella coriacea LEGE 07157]|uniref:ATP phosphoribosyltransferase regulatory subunit n=1 Tax=Lusitaniella coriacea LEGE 07157 TaxID=945747 RepID=A0A8J7AXK8_9CYAN|nr:ATP phosphoribosyltransferase regulatory subunit [Lusitaniella coriacea]MBE9115452.1 ATP phosphoribosyltransferase regulatory subunit [Lusitaniella coriacea LEGE 07157]
MSTIHQPPAGARDLLPLEVAQKRWIADRLQAVFHRWGYQRIITSTLEWLETLTAGGAIQRSTVIKLEDSSEGALGLRPELTASIARAAVTRMAGETYPQRLYYNANVFRRAHSGHYGKQLEFYQSGVELLFAGGVLADTEILLLLVECLHNLGLGEWNLVLGEAGLTRSLLSPFPDTVREKVRYCIANLDRVTLENLPLSPECLERALLLFDLRGKPEDVLQKVALLDLDETARETVNNLKSLVELLAQNSPVSLPLTLDLSLLETIDYYTGIVFEVVDATHTRILGKGGRYDRLLGLYHPQGQTSPGIGFALNLEDLHACLLSSPQLPQTTPSSDWLVIPPNPQNANAALAYAQKLRASQHLVRVEIDLGGRSREDIRKYARHCRISRLAWIQPDGTPEIETLKV